MEHGSRAYLEMRLLGWVGYGTMIILWCGAEDKHAVIGS